MTLRPNSSLAFFLACGSWFGMSKAKAFNHRLIQNTPIPSSPLDRCVCCSMSNERIQGFSFSFSCVWKFPPQKFTISSQPETPLDICLLFLMSTKVRSRYYLRCPGCPETSLNYQYDYTYSNIPNRGDIHNKQHISQKLILLRSVSYILNNTCSKSYT